MGSNMKKIFILAVVKKLVLVAVFVLYPVASEACMVDEGWEKRTVDKADKNKDGKIDYPEYKAMHSWSAADEHIAQNSWKSDLEKANKYIVQTAPDGKISVVENKAAEKRDYLTVKEFVSGFRPKCGN